MTTHAKVASSNPNGRDGLVRALTTVKAFAGVAMLFVVVVGALGYGEPVQLSAAAAGLVVALGLKKIHIIA